MTKIEKLVFIVVLGFIPPILLFVILWFSLYLLFPESKLIPFSILGLFLGLILDFIFMKRWFASCYEWQGWLLVAIFSFYHIGMIGFFMGVPVFNSLLGIIAGYYFGNRISKNSSPEEEKKKIVSRVALTSALAMFLICILSGSLALASPSTADDLKGMLGLNFKLSKELLILGIVLGGTGLVVFEYWVTSFVIKKVIKQNLKRATQF